MTSFKIKHKGRDHEVEVGQYGDIFEIGCTVNCDVMEDGEFDMDYVNIPNTNAPALIKELVRLFPDWDK